MVSSMPALLSLGVSRSAWRRRAEKLDGGLAPVLRVLEDRIMPVRRQGIGGDVVRISPGGRPISPPPPPPPLTTDSELGWSL